MSHAGDSDAMPRYCVSVVGPTGSGKSQLIQRRRFGSFSRAHNATLGVEFSTLMLSDYRMELGIWDVGGDGRFAAISHSYLQQSHALIFVFDMNCRRSFERTVRIMRDLQPLSAGASVRLLVGTKCDIAASHLRGFGDTAAAVATANTLAFLARQAFCARHRIDDSFVCSARANRGIEPLFAATARLLCERDRDCTPSDDRYFANLAAWWAHRSATVYAANSSSAPTIAAASRHCAFDLVAALVSAATACVRVVLAHSVFNRRSYAGPP